MLTRHICGHVGRDNEPGWRIAKASGFIRVAELRGRPVVDAATPCPGCRQSSAS